jgi:hypothetical protein
MPRNNFNEIYGTLHKSPEEVREIPSVMQDLEYRVGELTDLIYKLNDKLQPIINNNMAIPVEPQEATPSWVRESELAERINKQNEQLVNLTNKVNLILYTLEL